MTLVNGARVLVRVLQLDWLAFRRAFRSQLRENSLVALLLTLMAGDLCVRVYDIGRAGASTHSLALLLAWAGWGGGVSLAWMTGTPRAIWRLRTFFAVYRPAPPSPPAPLLAILLGRAWLFAIPAFAPLAALHLGSGGGGRDPAALFGAFLLVATCGPLSLLLGTAALRVQRLTLAGATLAAALLSFRFAAPIRSAISRWTPPGLVARILDQGPSISVAVLLAALAAWLLGLSLLASVIVDGRQRAARLRTGHRIEDSAVSGIPRLLGRWPPHLRREVVTALRWPRFRVSLLVACAAVAVLVAAATTERGLSTFRVLVAFVLPAVLCSSGMNNSFAADGAGVQVLIRDEVNVPAVFRAKEVAYMSSVLVVAMVGLALLGWSQGVRSVPIPGLPCAAIGVAVAWASCATGRITSVLFAKPQRAASLSGDLASPPAAMIAGAQSAILLILPTLVAIRVDAGRLGAVSLSATAVGVLVVAALWRVLCVRASVTLFSRFRGRLVEAHAAPPPLTVDGSRR